MAALTTLANNSGFIYVTASNGTDIQQNLTNTLNNVKKLLMTAAVGADLSGTPTINSNRYWLDAAGVAGVLSGTEITDFIVNRGLNSPLPVTSYTIATGVLTPIRKSVITVVNIDTEGAAASDTLDTITTTDYSTGDIIIFRGVSAARVVTFADGTGNLVLSNNSNFLTGDATNCIVLQYISGTGFVEISRSPNPAVTVAVMRAAGIPEPISGVNKTTLTNGGGTINLEPGVDKGVQVYDGTITMSASWTIQIQAAPVTPYLDGDTMIVEYRTLATTGANTVTIFGIALTTTQALEGRVRVIGTYKLSNTTWYYDIFYLAQGVDVENRAYTTATYEPKLGNPAANGYILSSTAAGVRSWIPNPGAGTATAVFTDAADRAAYFPAYIGAVGVQIDTNTEYVAYGLAAGEWQLPANTQVQSDTYAVATGTDTYAITLTPALAAYAAGNSFKVLFTNANTTAATINVNSLGAKAIKKNDSVALVANDIIAGKIYTITYDGTDFQIESNDSVIKNVQVSADKYAVATGTDTYAITLAPVPAAYVTGNSYNVLFTNGNTGAATLNVNALGAKSIKKHGADALVSGDIVAGKVYNCIYDGTNFQLDFVGKIPDGTVLTVDTTPVGNVGGGTDDLITYTVPAGTLSTNGDFLEVEMWGTILLDGSVTSINQLFGAMSLFGGAYAVPTTSSTVTFRIYSKIIRLTATTQQSISTLSYFNGSSVAININYIGTGTETLSGAIVLKMQATATNNNDVLQYGLIVRYN